MLAKAGYRVNATVRSEDKARAVYEKHPMWMSPVKFEYVADITAKGAFNSVFANADQPFDYITHTASPVKFNVEDIQIDLIDPAIPGYKT
jgi:nucleoside-diphosphate-sugar epimerase